MKFRVVRTSSSDFQQEIDIPTLEALIEWVKEQEIDWGSKGEKEVVLCIREGEEVPTLEIYDFYRE